MDDSERKVKVYAYYLRHKINSYFSWRIKNYYKQKGSAHKGLVEQVEQQRNVYEKDKNWELRQITVIGQNQLKRNVNEKDKKAKQSE